MSLTPNRKRWSPEAEDVADLVGQFIEYWGFKRIHGRIWTCLFLSPRALTATDLVDRLQVSKALISLSLSELLEFQVIEETPERPAGPGRRKGYRVNPRITEVITQVLRGREQRLLGRIAASITTLARSPEDELIRHDVSPLRIERLATMTQEASQALDAIISLSNLSLCAWSAFNLDEPPKS
jgi:DNA-binding transcriptional regulator GbsR (MarR family)